MPALLRLLVPRPPPRPIAALVPGLVLGVLLLGVPTTRATPSPLGAPESAWQAQAAGRARAAQQAPPRGQAPAGRRQTREQPGSGPGRSAPLAGDAAMKQAIEQLVREHVPSALIDKARQVARSLPAEQKQRLLAQARQTWSRVAPMLGNDPARLGAVVRKCLALVPPERLDAMLRVVNGALDTGGPGAAAALAELVAKGKRELLPQFLELIQGQGQAIAERARASGDEARVWRGLLAAVTVRDLLKNGRRPVARESLRALAQDVTLNVGGHPTTLDAWARNTLSNRFPSLEGSPATADGFATLSAALVATDLGELMSELPLVHTPFGDPVPPATYLADADPRDEEGIVLSLAALATTVKLREALKSGLDVAVSADAFAALAAGKQP